MDKQQSDAKGVRSTDAPVTFNFGQHNVRTIDKDGEVWFVANDVCDVLDIANPRNATARLDDDEKGVVSNDTPGGTQELTVINESGLYSLVLSSRKEQAREFKRWVTREVLPTIRKTGRFVHQPEPAPPPALPAPEANRADMLSVLGLASVTGQFVQQTVFDALLKQSGRDGWIHGRWLMSFDYKGTPQVKLVDGDAFVMSMSRLADAIVEPNGMMVSPVDLAKLAAACNRRLVGHVEYLSNKSNMTPKPWLPPPTFFTR